MKKFAGVALVGLMWVGAAHALETVPVHLVPTTVTAPEIDPAGMASALTLLAGGLAVLRGRRNSNK